LNNDKIHSLAVKRSLLDTYGELPSKFKFSCVNNVMKNYYKGNEMANPEKDDEDNNDEDDKIMVLKPSSNFGESLKKWRLNPRDPTPIPAASVQKRKLTNSPPEQNIPKMNVLKQPKLGFAQAFELQMGKRQKSESSEVSVKIDCKTTTPANTLKFEVIEPKEKEEDLELEELEKSFLSTEAVHSDEMPEFEDEDDIDGEPKVAVEFKIPSIPSTSNRIPSVIMDKPKERKNVFTRKVKVTLDQIRKQAKAEEEAAEALGLAKRNNKLKLRFKESIEPSKNKKAEAELETEIKKEMFKEMEVIGQFNLGRINSGLLSAAELIPFLIFRLHYCKIEERFIHHRPTRI